MTDLYSSISSDRPHVPVTVLFCLSVSFGICLGAIAVQDDTAAWLPAYAGLTGTLSLAAWGLVTREIYDLKN